MTNLTCKGGLLGKKFGFFGPKRTLEQKHSEHKGKDQGFWNNVLWPDKSKLELFDHSNSGHV